MSDDVTDEIMSATYRALCEHGYADLTMQDIADETAKSKAALHYHFDSKQELLEQFLAHLFEEFTDRVADPVGEDAVTQLQSFIDAALTPPDRDDQEAFQTAILEVKAQAPYNTSFREQLRAFDEFLYSQVRDLLAAGHADGSIREDVDPEDTARFIVTALDGAHTRQVAVGQPFECTRRMLEAYVDGQLAAEDRPGTQQEVTE